MTNNEKAIQVIQKYDDKLKQIKNSEGWYKYTSAIIELLKTDFISDLEKKSLKKYKEKD